MKTWREQIADYLVRVAHSIGVDPLLLVGLILLPIIIYRARELKNFKEQELWKKLFDIGFWIGAIGFFLLFAFIKFAD
ncbi:hypothetical protein [Rhodohalobacter mucosus]|jgi:4-hydroxybenzoate polyprenyltransferase|uniref:Uncharacterized protein n=1 Tax=Rhodohalobacter mucosus TaxID=2079485 RepID=A0A316TVP0_9BACT|nr:hypothetical protein [Rhodohalobacter mucosus]PWN08018.1 hypothetical protein DDZ15_03120 [Rhodohalobacter mucosus]